MVIGHSSEQVGRPKALQTSFDWQQLKQLAGGDSAFETELLEMFLQDAKRCLVELEEAIAAQSAETIEDVAHSLRGASANVGASALAKVARKLEQSARSGQLSEAQSLLQQLQNHCQWIQRHFQIKRAC